MEIVRGDFRMSSKSLSAGEDEEEGSEFGMRSEEFDDVDDEVEDGDDDDAVVDGHLEGSEIDSGMDSDEFDLLGSGEPGMQLCQVGIQSCSVPQELFDLEDLASVLSLETWNECLSEEERFVLAEFLPDMDQETFAYTVAELFAGKNFHFGSPLVTLLDQLKGGLCDPRIVLYRQGLSILQWCDYQHYLWRYHDDMVKRLALIGNTLQNCASYNGKGRTGFWSTWRQNPLNSKRIGHLVSETNPESGSSDSYWSKDLKADMHCAMLSPDAMQQYSKSFLMANIPKMSVQEEFAAPAKKAKRSTTDDLRVIKDNKYQMALQAEWTGGQENALVLKRKKKKTKHKYDRDVDDSVYPDHYDDIACRQGKRMFGDYAVASACYNGTSISSSKSYPEEDWACSARGQTRNSSKKETHFQRSTGSQPTQHIDMHQDHDDLFVERGEHGSMHRAGKSNVVNYMNKSYKAIAGQDDCYFQIDNQAGASEGIIKSKHTQKSVPKKTNKYAKVDRSRYSYYPDTGSYLNTTEVEAYPNKAKKVKKNRSSNTEKRGRAMVDQEQASQQLYVHDYNSGLLDECMVDVERVPYMEGTMSQTNKYRSRRDVSHAQVISVLPNKMSTMPLRGCNYTSLLPKWNVDGVHVGYTDQQFDYSNIIKKKGKRKLEGLDALTAVIPDIVMPEERIADAEMEMKPQRKTFTLITPTIHTGFSFSVVHLLSAVRKAMITNVEDLSEIKSHLETADNRPEKKMTENEAHKAANSVDISDCRDNRANTSQPAVENHVHALTVQEIVSRVRSNPGDPYILETQEPLQDLVRGTLKIFSSRTAPLGAKGWKPLVSYGKSNKSWSWVGPSGTDTTEEENSPEAWGIPHKMLVKLVDAFANWLKSGQETLRQIGSLPAPPASLFTDLDGKDRFKDLRAQKSPNTIGPSTDEVRAYFRKEEHLRYLIPDRTFSYTAADGKKSIVAPIRRGGGKPTSKARDHFMLKSDRPPHVTILCLVRDAAARLPASIGTRADVCTLIRDSQYIVETVTDIQVNQVVSGALDRLHYECDPCVQFDADKKIWKYLHRDREEEDFEDDGTSSTKKVKRRRKEATDQSEPGVVNDIGHGTGDAAVAGSPMSLDDEFDLNIDASSSKPDEDIGVLHNDKRASADKVSFMNENSEIRNLVCWETLKVGSLQEVCDYEAYGLERPVGISSQNLL